MMRKWVFGTLFLVAGAAVAQPFSIGIKGGVPFTGGFPDVTTQEVDLVSRTFSNSNEYIVGPMVELHLPLGLSVEADALYRPLNLTVSNTLVPQPTPFRNSSNIVSWEFPVLGKFRFPFPVVKPYIEAGPSFRAIRYDYFSKAGFTVGGGVELKISRLRIGPELRFTHWGADSAATNSIQAPSNVNQGEFLIGFSF